MSHLIFNFFFPSGTGDTKELNVDGNALLDNVSIYKQFLKPLSTVK